MMTTKVHAPNALSPSRSFSLESMAGYNHWTPEALNLYLNSQWIYPYSQMVMSGIKTCFGNTFIDNDDFQNCYFVWEHLSSLLCHYYKCNAISDNWFPLGGFVRKRYSIMRHGEDYYTDFFQQAEQQQNEWLPLKQGLFEGNYSVYKQEYDEAEKFYKDSRHY